LANYDAHLNQAVKNIGILEKVNSGIAESWDWQVTIVFYSSLHLANAHIAKTINEHYRTHAKVSEALNPYVTTNPSKFEEDAYLAYLSLQNLSRRSRYLCNDKDPKQNPEAAHFTSDKQLAKAIRDLEMILIYFNKIYGITFNPSVINCPRIKADKLKYFSAS